MKMFQRSPDIGWCPKGVQAILRPFVPAGPPAPLSFRRVWLSPHILACYICNRVNLSGRTKVGVLQALK